MRKYSPKVLQAGPDGEAGVSCGLDAEENMGISSPLYQIIDVVFDLRARGFLRRQVASPSPALLCFSVH